MCGRYALYGPTSRMREQFGVEPDDRIDRYNVAPTQQAPVIRSSGSGPELGTDHDFRLPFTTPKIS